MRPSTISATARPITIRPRVTAWSRDEDKRRAFFNAYTRLQNRIQLFLNLPLAKLDRTALTTRLKEIGQS